MTNLSNTQSQVLPHTHTESEIIGLSTDLAGKQDKLVPAQDGNIIIAADGKTISAIDTKYTALPGGNVTINANNEISAIDTKYDPATQSTAGLMSAADKLKLDGIEPGAGVAKVSGVKGDAESSYREGLVNITKANIGLGNVDNTSDANKPISTATQSALDLKQNIADMPTDLGDFTNNAGFIKNTVNDLANYYKKTETYTQTEIDTLIQNFGGFEVVATLPTSDIKSNIIYLLGPIGTGPDRYEEWIYYSSTWTKIGETSVDLTNYVTTNTAQTISGAKTFSTEPVLPSKTAAPTNSATAPATERQIYDVSAASVKTTGDQTIAGVKTFQSSPVVPAPTNNTDAATKKYVDDGLATKQDKATNGSTAPSVTPSYIGQFYVDTTNHQLYVATGTSSSSDWFEVGAGFGDVLYSDFNWQTKTGATVTLDLASTITPSANFTVNAPATIKDGQTYILRVNNGSTAYTMTLGTHITNPYGTSIALTKNGVDQFVFLAIGGDLELQPEVQGGSSSDAMILHPESPLKPKYNWYGTQAQYEALSQYYYENENDTVYHTIDGTLETSGTRSLSKGLSSLKSEPVEPVKVKTEQEQADEVMDAALDAVDDKETMPDVKIEQERSEDQIERMNLILDTALDFNSTER